MDRRARRLSTWAAGFMVAAAFPALFLAASLLATGFHLYPVQVVCVAVLVAFALLTVLACALAAVLERRARAEDAAKWKAAEALAARVYQAHVQAESTPRRRVLAPTSPPPGDEETSRFSVLGSRFSVLAGGVSARRSAAGPPVVDRQPRTENREDEQLYEEGALR
jgi:hypothetical protein